jgi:hypothetical protein
LGVLDQKSQNLAAVLEESVHDLLTFVRAGHEMSECEGVPKPCQVADRLETAQFRVQG